MLPQKQGKYYKEHNTRQSHLLTRLPALLPTPQLMALRAFPGLNLGLPARDLLPVSPGLREAASSESSAPLWFQTTSGMVQWAPHSQPLPTPQHRKSRLPAPEEVPHLVNKSNIYKFKVLELVPPRGSAFKPRNTQHPPAASRPHLTEEELGQE